MTPRVIFAIFATALCWLGVSLLSVGGRHDGYLGNLWWRLRQAARFDEELIAFSCFLLFSVAVAVHLVAVRWRASYRARFLPPQLGVLYAVAALVLGSVLRQPLRQPWEVWFHVVFTLAAVIGFVALFGRRYFRILRHEPDA
jgi:hypothetical protein